MTLIFQIGNEHLLVGADHTSFPWRREDTSSSCYVESVEDSKIQISGDQAAPSVIVVCATNLFVFRFGTFVISLLGSLFLFFDSVVFVD